MRMDLTHRQAAAEGVSPEGERLPAAAGPVRAGTWSWDADTGALFWSEASERLHGLEPGSFHGTFESALEMVHPLDREATREATRQLVVQGVAEAEYRVIRPDGSERWIAWSGKATAVAPGEPVRATGVYVNITERKLAEEALRESESRFREMANSAPILMFATDPSGACTFVNDRWKEYTGRGPEEAYGRGWQESVHPDDRRRFDGTYAKSIRDHSTLEVEYRLRRANGEYSWVLARSAPVVHGTEFRGFIGSCFDITERRRAEASLQLLAELAGVLASAANPDSAMVALARAAVPVFADWCVVASSRPAGKSHRVASVHAEEAGQRLLDDLAAYLNESGKADLVIQQALDSQTPLFEPVFSLDLYASQEDKRQLDTLAQLGAVSRICVPLAAHGRLLGVAAFSRAGGRSRFDEEDLRLAEDLGRRVALAVGNATLAQEAEQRELDLKNANTALQFLADAGIELSSSLLTEESLQRMANIAVPVFADICIVDVLQEESAVARMAIAARDQQLLEQAARLDVPPADAPSNGPFMERLSAGLSVFMPRITESALRALSQDPEQLERMRAMNLRSGLIVPLMARGQVLGAITFVRTQGPSFNENDLATAEQLGRRAGLAVDNLRLYQESRRIEDELRRRNDGMRLLADASAELSATLSYTEALDRLARLAVPRVADWCAIDLLDERGQIERVTVIHKDPELVRLARQLQQQHPLDPGAETGVARVLRTGEAEFYPEISRRGIAEADLPAAYKKALRSVGMHSAIIAPLYSRGRVLGAITFAMSEGGHNYDENDLAVAKEIGQRAGVAVENARLYTAAQEHEAELLHANEAKDEFLGMMSHELRTPITVIHGGAHVLRSRSNVLDEETREGLLKDVEREAERLSRMLENLLDMARVELDQEPTIEPVLIQRLCERLVAQRPANPQHPLELQADAGLPPVAAEPSYLEHVVRNLLSNAEKYSPDGRPIELRLGRTADDSVEVTVLDRGMGIEANEATRIFERFYRSDRTANIAGGAGMGLAVCKRLIEAMSGQIWARPREGGGLEVGFRLPVYEENEA